MHTFTIHCQIFKIVLLVLYCYVIDMLFQFCNLLSSLFVRIQRETDIKSNEFSQTEHTVTCIQIKNNIPVIPEALLYRVFIVLSLLLSEICLMCKLIFI